MTLTIIEKLTTRSPWVEHRTVLGVSRGNVCQAEWRKKWKMSEKNVPGRNLQGPRLTHAHTHTHRQLLTGYTISSAS